MFQFISNLLSVQAKLRRLVPDLGRFLDEGCHFRLLASFGHHSFSDVLSLQVSLQFVDQTTILLGRKLLNHEIKVFYTVDYIAQVKWEIFSDDKDGSSCLMILEEQRLFEH